MSVAGYNPFGSVEEEAAAIGGSPFGEAVEQGMGVQDDQMAEYDVAQRQQDLYAKKADIEGIQAELQNAQAEGSAVQGSINTAAIDAALQGNPGDPAGRAQVEVAVAGAEQEVNNAKQLQTSMAMEKVGGALQNAALAGTLGGLGAGIAAVASLVNQDEKITGAFREVYAHMKSEALLTTPTGEVYDHNKDILLAQEQEKEVEPTKKTLVMNEPSTASLGVMSLQANLQNLKPALGGPDISVG